MNASRSLRRLWRHPYVVIAAAVLFASGIATVGGTFASFSAETQNNTSTFAGGWLGTASNLTVTPSGYDAVLGWTPGTHGLDGQQLWGFDNGASSTCLSTSSYAQLNTMAAATTTSYTKTYSTAALNGHYECFQMLSTRSGSSWTATGSFPATQLGLVMTGLAINSSVTANGALNTGDTITATFNQPVILTAQTSKAVVCESWTAAGALTIFLDDVAYGGGNACSAAPSYRIELTGLTKAAGAANTQTVNATITFSANAPWTATWTLTGNGQTVTGGSATGTPSSTILSTNGGADQAAACTSGALNCTPAATGHGF